METLRNLVIWDNTSLPSNQESLMCVGGKGLGLHELKKAGFNVPSFATITASMFKQICASDSRLADLFAQENIEHKEKAGLIRKHLKNKTLDGIYEKILVEVWDKISRCGKRPVAVRSSAADEDSKVLSFAGQMDSFLNIRSFEAFLNAVCNCWASLFADRAVLYRIQNKINPWTSQIAVVVQQMIESEISGVIFSVNPLTGNTKEMMVSSVWGLGEGIVQGALDADTFILDKDGRIITSQIAEKKQKIIYNQQGGIISVEVEFGKQRISSLEKRQLKDLLELALRVEKFKNTPIDIEFGIVKNKIYLLQARPITNLKKYRQGKDNFTVWDNSNIVESYSGVTTPLTFSFIRKAYFAVYWQFCETIGVSKKIIFKKRYVLENMLGLICGRVYYNLLNWYRLVSLMPGFKYNRRFMEQMMGLSVIKDFPIEDEERHNVIPHNKFDKYFIELPRLAKVGVKMFIAHITLQKKIAAFHNHFNKIYNQHRGFDYSTKTAAELFSVYRTLEDEILWKWKPPITNDFSAMIFYGLLKNLTVKWGVDQQGTLQNELLCGEGGIKSTEVTTRLFYITKTIEKDEKLKTAFLELSPDDALRHLESEHCFSEINRLFKEYLSEYGVRCIDEMKLESIPIRDNPAFCIAMMQNYLRRGVPDVKEQENRERNIRKKAERILKGKLRNKFVFGFIPKIFIYNWILKNTRRAIKNRENQRFCRTEAYSLVRTIFRAIGKQWQKKGIIEKLEDIFYLEMDEVWSFIDGTSTCVHLEELISLRKKEFGNYLAETSDDHIETYGEVYYGNVFHKEEAEITEGGILQGLGCCSGVVEKEVKVVLKPDNNLQLNGEIMAAKQTDPGWVVLFPSVSGLIIEKGSLLSHSAIVAREMGIPAVVGVKDATKILRTGDRVLLNGAEGTVKILIKSPFHPPL